MELLDYEKEHLARVRSGLAECMVLLRKNGAFPLQEPCRLAAYGNGVRHGMKSGTGSSHVNSRLVVSVEQGLRDAGFELAGTHWLDAYDKRRAKAKKDFYRQLRKEANATGANLAYYALGAIMAEPEYAIPMDLYADAAIYVLSRSAGEGADRKVIKGDVLLTETEIRDILLLNERYEHFMLVLNTGGPVDLSPVQEVGNILLLSQLGSQMGSVLADVLLGRENPSGKLATTWSAVGDYCPDVHLGDPDDTWYHEGVYVGYRYFDTVGKRAAFPFGYGLSYTDFALEGAAAQVDGAKVRLSVCVKNIGGIAGKQVVQAYATAPEVELKKPWQELAGFAKTGLLQPGESEELEISFSLLGLASFDESASAYVLEPGEYVVRLGTSSVDAEPVAVVELENGVVVRKASRLVAPAGFEDCVYDRVARTEALAGVPHLRVDPSCLAFPEADVGASTSGADSAVDPAVAALSDEELVCLSVGHFDKRSGVLSLIGDAASQVAGAAGQTSEKLADKGFPSLVMADGPAGLRLAREFYRDDAGAHSLGGDAIPEGILDVFSAPVRLFLHLWSGGGKAPRGAKVETQYCTALPAGTAIAQSWNLDYAWTCGDIVGDEMERFGVDLWLAPALNIHRSILCGRNFEYFSEDPLVSGKMAAAMVAGVQAHPGRDAVIKHYAANNQETNRYYNDSRLSERALREIYLKGFQVCVRESNPAAVMTSYNLVNGVHTSESRSLIEGFLRAENDFEGIVVSDWVVRRFNTGGYHPAACVVNVVAAGGDLFMPGSKEDYADVLTALHAGKLSRHQLEVNATRVLRVSRRLRG